MKKNRLLSIFTVLFVFLFCASPVFASKPKLSDTEDTEKTVYNIDDSITINASAGTGGTISASGPVKIPYGRSKTFTISPDTGFNIAK